MTETLRQYLDDIEAEAAVPAVARNPVGAGTQEILPLAAIHSRQAIVPFRALRVRLDLDEHHRPAIA